VDKQEPVAVFRREILGRGQIFWLRSSDELPNETPLYTAPPQPEPTIDGWPLWSGLPQQEEQGLTATPLPAIKLQDDREEHYKSFAQNAQVIGIPEQEPIAYLGENAVGHKYFRWKKPPSTYKPIALYTAHATPQRIWQGLTDEELLDLADMAYANDLELLQTLQAKLKEKNT
jgi:hypothetical protein